MDFELSQTHQPVDKFFKDIAFCFGSWYSSVYVRDALKLHDVTRAMMAMKENATKPEQAADLLDIFPLIDSIT